YVLVVKYHHPGHSIHGFKDYFLWFLFRVFYLSSNHGIWIQGNHSGTGLFFSSWPNVFTDCTDLSLSGLSTKQGNLPVKPYQPWKRIKTDPGRPSHNYITCNCFGVCQLPGSISGSISVKEGFGFIYLKAYHIVIVDSTGMYQRGR
ncbi:MAG: hypothetical protein H6Q59_3098, partial [Firmicutes bacterium]|nr:hypothetical protein [Bacillota bacterium]